LEVIYGIFLFVFYENKTEFLALMEAASSQRSEEIQRTAGRLVHKKTIVLLLKNPQL